MTQLPTNFTLAGNKENPNEFSQENWMRNKRQKGLNWSGSSQFQMHGVGNVMEAIGSASFGVGHGNYLYGPCNFPNGLGVGNAIEVSGEKLAIEKAYPYHQIVQKTVGFDVMETAVSEKVHRRMIRNRESAARSRARKQAYNAQQQIEIMKLKKENELLRKVMKVLMAIIKTKREKMPTLSRTFSAPL